MKAKEYFPTDRQSKVYRQVYYHKIQNNYRPQLNRQVIQNLIQSKKRLQKKKVSFSFGRQQNQRKIIYRPKIQQTSRQKQEKIMKQKQKIQSETNKSRFLYNNQLDQYIIKYELPKQRQEIQNEMAELEYILKNCSPQIYNLWKKYMAIKIQTFQKGMKDINYWKQKQLTISKQNETKNQDYKESLKNNINFDIELPLATKPKNHQNLEFQIGNCQIKNVNNFQCKQMTEQNFQQQICIQLSQIKNLGLRCNQTLKHSTSCHVNQNFTNNIQSDQNKNHGNSQQKIKTLRRTNNLLNQNSRVNQNNRNKLKVIGPSNLSQKQKSQNPYFKLYKGK